MDKAILRSGSSWLAIFATQGIICGAALADPITVNETINLNQALSAGNGNYAGLFDINSLLPSGGNYSDPLNIVSATVSAYGYSNPAQTYAAYSNGYSYYAYAGTYTYQYQYSYTYSYSCGWGDTCYATGYSYAYASAPVYDEISYQTLTYYDQTMDTLALNAGADNFSGSDSQNITDLGTSGGYSGSGGGYYGDPLYEYYNYTDTVDNFISGPLSASGALSAASLALLSQGGQLAFSLDAAAGQLNVTQLDLTVTLNQSVSVPEPGSLPVFGFGLLLIALGARQYRRPSAN